MSQLPGNPFAERIESLADEHAEVATTLALAYEQRTANLIAAYRTSDLIEFDTILARLGLDGTK